MTNPTALVTGAASGIGLATARRLRAAGAGRLLLCDRNAAGLDAAAATIGGDCLTLAGDVADEGYWAGVAPRCAGLAWAVINAGISTAAPIADLTFAEWRRTLATNLDGTFLTLRTALGAMAAGGAIVLVASASGLKAEAGIAAYAASKAGAIQLMRVAAKEAAPRGIRINAVAPGGVETPMWDAMPAFRALAAAEGREAAFRAMAAATPLGRFATADEIAGHIAYLLSDAAAGMTGSVMTIDGGYTG
ncbi:MAG: SDR family oxidoreductase [Sphingomonas fennica]